MIQRIQTLYLLAAIALVSALSFVRIAELVTIDSSIFFFNLKGFFHETVSGPERVLMPWSLFVLAQLINVVLLCSVFLFRRRIVQMRLCVYAMVLIAGLSGMIFYITQHVHDAEIVSYRLPVTFPLIALILVYLRSGPSAGTRS